MSIQMDLGLPRLPRYCQLCYCLTYVRDWSYSTNNEVVRMIEQPMLTIPHPRYEVRVDCLYCNLTTRTMYAKRGDEFIPFEVHTERHGFY